VPGHSKSPMGQTDVESVKVHGGSHRGL
jgi:hypothetical protein